MNLQRLEGFYWVARCGGYARAARSFPYPITAAGLHQQVRRLEAELGVRLFERTGRERLIRTASGSRLYEHVAPFLEQLPALIGQLSSGELRGRIRVRAPAQILRALMPSWLARLATAHPKLEVELDDIGDGDLSLLRRGEADVWIDHLESVPADLESQPVATLRAFLVLAARHPLARGRAPALRALAGQPFVAYSGDRRWRALQLAALAAEGVRPARLVGASSSDTILSLVAAGLGYSLVPSLAIGPEHPALAAWPLPGRAAEFPVVAAWRRGTSDQPLVTAFLAAAPPPGRRGAAARARRTEAAASGRASAPRGMG